jgi:hypothetical protein
MEIPKIDVDDSQLPQLIIDMEKGKLQVPRFQRDFVWPIPKTRALLDSIFKEFPIGTFFLWKVPAHIPQFVKYLEEMGIPKPPLGSEITYILDGQQRLTSLFFTINGKKYKNRDYGRICIDLDTASRYMQNHLEGFDEDIFVFQKPDNVRYIPVMELVGENALNIFDNLKQEWKSAFNKAHNLLNNYPFSVVWIQGQEIDNAIDIFQRINQGGQRLSRYDLVCANVWREDFDFRSKVQSENKIYETKGFGHLHETIFTQAFSLILRGKCTIIDELSLETDQIKHAWAKVINALRQAVDFASNNLGVKRYAFLPYRGILAVLAYCFYFYPNPDQKEQKLLWQWFWQVTLSERYSSTSPSRMQEDIEKLNTGFKAKNYSFNYPVHVTPEAVANTKMSSTSSALRNATLCLLALKQPRNFKNNNVINVKDDFYSDLVRAERHHVFPVGFLSSQGFSVEKVHYLPNFCFIPADLNKEIGKKPPIEYMAKYQKENSGFNESIATHLIPIDSDSPIWKNEYNAFLTARAALIADELNRISGLSPDVISPIKNQIEYRLDAIEDQVREVIHTQFEQLMGAGYWKKMIPSDIQDVIQRKIKDHISKNPQDEHSIISNDRIKLDFCDFSDYDKIIQKNWEVFNSIFMDKTELEKHLTNLRNLRNPFKHNRAPTNIDLKNGEAALIWMEACLNRIPQEQPQIIEEDIGDS